MKGNVQYEKIEQYIYEINTSTYDILNALTPFYRYKLYEKIRKISNLDDNCDAEMLADAVVNTLSRMKKDVLDSFELASYSYRNLLQVQRITKTRLTRKANRYRINIRRILGLSRDDDEVQLSFDNDKKERYAKSTSRLLTVFPAFLSDPIPKPAGHRKQKQAPVLCQSIQNLLKLVCWL